MRRWFLSYNSQDLALMQLFEQALRRKDSEAHVYFAPKSERAGGFWLPALAHEIAEATIFVLLVGEKGVGPWQVLEYNEALARRAKEPAFALVPVVLDGQPAPGLPFLRQLHWVITADPASEKSVAQVMDAGRRWWRATAAVSCRRTPHSQSRNIAAAASGEPNADEMPCIAAELLQALVFRLCGWFLHGRYPFGFDGFGLAWSRASTGLALVNRDFRRAGTIAGLFQVREKRFQ